MPDLFFIAAGGFFVLLWACAAGILLAPRAILPLPVRFLSGSVLVSLTIFTLLIAHAGYLSVWLTLGTLTIGAAIWRLRILTLPRLPRMNIWFRLLFAGYGLIYLIYTLAPEIEPDAVTYHLGLVYEYVRMHSFSSRLGFYELLPQGVDLLFVPAFAIGAHSAAKLVHFSFLAAAVSLIRHICFQLEIGDVKACAAAAIFFIAPVTAVTSTSAYTDATLVCCCCSILWLAIRWDRNRTRCLLLLAGLDAGFCYAIKPTFAWVTLVALVFFTLRSKKGMSALLFSGAAAVAILPWMIRAVALTGNPFAPFLNAWFPSEAFTAPLESALLSAYSAFRPAFSWRGAIVDYTILGGNQGILGPAFLFLPLSLLAVRRKSARWLIVSAFLVAVPILSNTGTRFLMPSAAIGSMALVAALPAPGAIALVAVQMLGAANPVIDLYDTRHDWRPGEIPLRAVLGIETPQHYLERKIYGFGNDRMITARTPLHARVFALAAVHQAYVSREVLVYWQSALADRFVDALGWAQQGRGIPGALLSWKWPAATYSSLRVTPSSDLRILEGEFDRGGASPGTGIDRRIFAIPWIFATPRKAGKSFDLRTPTGATGAGLVIWPETAGAQVEGQPSTGEWRVIQNSARTDGVAIDPRRDVTALIRRSGYHYILTSAEKGAFAFIGKELLDHPAEWGVVPAGRSEDVWLFYISTN